MNVNKISLDRLLALTDEQLKAFKANNGFDDRAFWDFILEKQRKELEDGNICSFRDYDALRHNIKRIIGYFLYSILLQEQEEYSKMDRRYMGCIDKIIEDINGLMGVKVACLRQGKTERVIGIVWYNDKGWDLSLEGLAVLPEYQEMNLGTGLLWDMIKSNHSNIQVFRHSPKAQTGRIVLYRPEDLENVAGFYKNRGFLHWEAQDMAGPYRDETPFGKGLRKMALPLSREAFLRHLGFCEKLSPKTKEALASMEDEQMIISYLRIPGKKHSAHYDESYMAIYDKKRSQFHRLFDALNPLLIALVMRLDENAIRREPLFQSYLNH